MTGLDWIAAGVLATGYVIIMTGLACVVGLWLRGRRVNGRTRDNGSRYPAWFWARMGVGR